MRSNYKRLGDYIQEVKVRNKEEKAEQLLGINIDKFFIPSVANIVGTDLSVYKLVRKNQFACNRKHRAGFKLTVEAYSSFGGYIETGYPVRPARQSVFNAFMAENFPGAIDNSGETPAIDYRKLKVSRGTLPSMEVLSATVDSTGIVLTFDSRVYIPKASSNDVVIMLVKTVSGRLYFARGVRGAEEAMTLTVPVAGITKEDVVCTYLIMTTVDGKKASESVFVELG